MRVSIQPKDILLVEDEEKQVYYEKLILNLLGANVDVARSLEETKEKLIKNGYDYILLDLGLPDSNGLNTLKRVKEMTNDKIVIMTGNQDPEIKKYALKVNVSKYIIKGDLKKNDFKKILNGGENNNVG